jgi:hypothetical protein
MATKMSQADWDVALEAFRAYLPWQGVSACNDWLFLEALHWFSV